MARLARYKEDHASFGEFILSERMRDVTAEVARDIALDAARRAPRGNGPGPHMADQFRVVREAGVLRIGEYTRVMVRVVNADRAAALNEFGVTGEDGIRRQRHRMLGRAGAAFGDFKPDESWLL